MTPLGRARKATSSATPPTTLRKQAHGLPHSDSGANIFSTARKSTNPGVLQRVYASFPPRRVRFYFNLTPDAPYCVRFNGSRKRAKGSDLILYFSKQLTICTAAPPVLITSRPYRIAGVAGFHRGIKLPVTGSARPERKLKPIPHKNVGGSRIDHGLNMSRDTNASGRHLDGTATKSLDRRTRAVAQVTSSRKHDLLVNQPRQCVIAPYAFLLKVVS